MTDKLNQRMAQLYLGMFAGLLVPGGVYFVRGKYLKGVLICLAVLASFFIGLLITQNYAFSTQTAERHPVMFYLQYLVGAPSVVAHYLSPHIIVTPPFIDTKIYEIGVLYIAIAGLLNVLAYVQGVSGILIQKTTPDTEEDMTIAANLKSKKALLIYLGVFAIVILGLILLVKSLLINSYIEHFFIICAFVSIVTGTLRKKKPLQTGLEIVQSYLILSAGIIIFAFFLYFLQQPELLFG